MTDSPFDLTGEMRKCVDDYLELIEDSIESRGLSWSERRGILEDVETHIMEMLAKRAPKNPTLPDVQAVYKPVDSI